MMDAGALRRSLEGLRGDAVLSVRMSVRLPDGRTVAAEGPVAGLEVTENPALAMQWVTLRSSSDLAGDACALLDLGMISEDEWEVDMMG